VGYRVGQVIERSLVRILNWTATGSLVSVLNVTSRTYDASVSVGVFKATILDYT
jgi:hypothetical protein